MQSKFIAIEGLDGSGKSTQIALLRGHLEAQGIKTQFIHFPRTGEGVYGHLIARFLRGDFGDARNVHPQLVALLFAQDRKEFAATISRWLDEGYFVLVDRYVLSNIAFQCAKLRDEKEKQTLSEWINSFEYEHNQIPRPHLSIYLDVTFSFTEASLLRTRKGAQRDYLKGKEDIHEKDLALQRAVKNEYERLLASESDIAHIVCYDEDNKMRPIPDIHNEIVSRLE